MTLQRCLRFANLFLIVLFPIAWFVPLLEIGLFDKIKISVEIFNLQFPELFGLKEVTVVTGIQSLWSEDKYLALLVTFFALFAPMAKTIGLSLVQYDLLSEAVKPVIHFIGKLAMADVFIIAITCILIKGVGIGKMDVLWGTYLFSFCVIMSTIISYFSKPSK
jgi:paraquat-inducible protein A